MSGRFKKVSRIGKGTFGEAWLVTSTCSGRRYVIKEVRVDEMSEEELEKTRTEATILARCKHNSIIRYKEYFMLPNPTTMCLVMEYADGGDLAMKVKTALQNGATISENTILHWFIQVIFAVQYLHANNILHRDLKTQNIFLTKTNLVKVGDFGIARFLRDKQDLATTAIGTPYYLSPEICQRRPYNHKSDIWAVGCILYELCALRHPFLAENFEDLIIKILRGAFKPLPELFSSLIKDLISVMLRTKPERRPTADALLMLPALKPYVENYLQQYEELFSKKGKCPSSSDDKIPIEKDFKCPGPVESDNEIKASDIVKQQNDNNNSYEVENREKSNQEKGSHDHAKGIPLAIKESSRSSVGEEFPINTPLKSNPRSRRAVFSMSSQADSDTRSPNSPLLNQTPSQKRGSSPVHPPAPPNTPVNGNYHHTPPSITLINATDLCSVSRGGTPGSSSKVRKISLTDDNFWRTPDHAPTPCNTPTEFDLSPSTPSGSDICSTDHKSSDEIRHPHSSVSEVDDCGSHEWPQMQNPQINCQPDIPGPLDMESSYNRVYARKRCDSCGRGFNETYTLDKSTPSDSSVDNVFEL